MQFPPRGPAAETSLLGRHARRPVPRTRTLNVPVSPTADGSGNTYVYDAWNRLVAVSNAGSKVAAYSYDGSGRRLTETHGVTTTDLYYSAQWQALEERVGGQVQARSVWSPVYVDALILRDQSSQGNGVLDQRLYAVQDSNWNVTALLDTMGNTVERYVYEPYGAMTVLAADWTTRASSNYGWIYLFKGGRLEEATGLYSFRERNYSAMLGRWLQQDPLGFNAGDPNLYGFVGNMPTTHADPTGLESYVYPWNLPNSTISAPSWQQQLEMEKNGGLGTIQLLTGAVTAFLGGNATLSGNPAGPFAMDVGINQMANAPRTMLGMKEQIPTIHGRMLLNEGVDPELVGHTDMAFGMAGSFPGGSSPSRASPICRRGNAPQNPRPGNGGPAATAHGAERLADPARTLSQAEISAARRAHTLRQADGATVYIHQVELGKFNVFVEGERGIVTTFRHLDTDAVRRLAINYGWTDR